MMNIERLRSWQPEASEEQLALFAQENAALLALLDDSWAKFKINHAEFFQAATGLPVSESRYAEGFSVDDLEHLPVSDAELMEFVRAFDNERPRKDRPFGDGVRVNDQNWDVLE
ncbi:phenylacetate--CoA ligase [Kingella negevensis]|nr:phenylacetate--CoA ligase [Kingella negevensis]MDK4679658.1 phenylacetate--CoA ligase [Kingella negevensis]MDK4682623.1 phenylacetate--CoA ligase [Kingella negevensis]MDK4690820.1 phenylacetate--CoA ligase [Kingella negevensis]